MLRTCVLLHYNVILNVRTGTHYILIGDEGNKDASPIVNPKTKKTGSTTSRSTAANSSCRSSSPSMVEEPVHFQLELLVNPTVVRFFFCLELGELLLELERLGLDGVITERPGVDLAPRVSGAVTEGR
jgi:hypothetical protein